MSLALITPSYSKDYQRCALLCRTVDDYVPTDLRHYLLVDDRDLRLFSTLENNRRRLIPVESMLPWWIMRMPYSRRWWLSFRSLPIRNWILQQIVKLSVTQHIDADSYMFVDSDVVFVKPFDLTRVVRGAQLRLFRVPGSGRLPKHARWHRSAARMLGLPKTDYFGSDYIGNLVTWRRDKLLELRRHIAKIGGKGWLTVVSRNLHLSEYILYGAFIEFISGDPSGHYFDADDLCHCSWHRQINTKEQLVEFIGQARPEHLAVLVQSNLHFDPADYEHAIRHVSQKINTVYSPRLNPLEPN